MVDFEYLVHPLDAYPRWLLNEELSMIIQIQVAHKLDVDQSWEAQEFSVMPFYHHLQGMYKLVQRQLFGVQPSEVFEQT